jgi:hypothetical protein
MYRRVILVRTCVSVEGITSIIRVERIGELGTTLAVPVFLRNLLQLLFTANVVPGSLISYHDVGDTFLRNVGSYKSNAASHPRRRHSSNSVLAEVQVQE